MKYFLLTTVFLVIHLPEISAQPTDPRFEKWDSNKDGKLTKEELPKGIQRNFSKVDTDNDGAISLKEHLAFLNRRPQRQPSLEGVTFKKDITYAGTNDPRQQLDLLLPAKRATTDPLPVLVFIHGGGWRTGNKSSGYSRIGRYVGSGEFVGFSVGYRLSKQAQWPAQIHDCKAAIRWIRAHSKEYNLDPDRIGVMGSSAGGHLVAMLGTTGDVKDLEGKLGDHLDQSSRVQCVINFFGPTNFLTMGDFPSKINHNAADSPEADLLGGAIPENKEVARAASPITHITKDDPPMISIHGTKDELVPVNQSEMFHQALQKAGVTSELILVKDAGHGGLGNGLDGEKIRAFINKHLNNQ